jgi:predicted  nucleic acid-binding Zn-ribbon protein
MAKESKKDPQEYTVEEKLKSLYQLQLIFSEIDHIKTLRGELPLEVQDLEDEVAGLRTRIGNISGSIEEIKQEESKRRIKIEEAKAMIEKYTEDQNNVRNNREYDLLAKEIEFQTLEVEFCEKKLRQYAGDLKAKSEEIERTNAQLEERISALEDKRNELEEIVSETKEEEEKLRDRAKVLEGSIEPRLLQSFKRIRKNTRNGLGVVYVQRDACGGCFNKIPPQRQLDIKMRKKIIVCEYCGRIMIDPELAGVKETTVQAPEKKTRKRAIRKTEKNEGAAE